MSMKKSMVAALVAAAGLGGAFGLVEKFEGNVPTVYIDPVGIRTICRGHTGSLTKKGTATPDECDRVTLEDLQVAQQRVHSCIKVPMTNSEENAWVSFTFNVGLGGKGVKDGMCILKSGAVPSHVRLLNAGKHREACYMMAQWTQPGTAVHRGLTRRRTDEMALCLKELP